MADSNVFSKLMDEHGNLEGEETERAERETKPEMLDAAVQKKESGQQAALMQEEERLTGAVTWRVYSKYFRYAGSIFWAPVILILLILTQGSQGVS